MSDTSKATPRKLSDLEILFKRDKLARELAEMVLDAYITANPNQSVTKLHKATDRARQLLKLYKEEK